MSGDTVRKTQKFINDTIKQGEEIKPLNPKAEELEKFMDNMKNDPNSFFYNHKNEEDKHNNKTVNTGCPCTIM